MFGQSVSQWAQLFSLNRRQRVAGWRCGGGQEGAGRGRSEDNEELNIRCNLMSTSTSCRLHNNYRIEITVATRASVSTNLPEISLQCLHSAPLDTEASPGDMRQSEFSPVFAIFKAVLQSSTGSPV